MLSAAVATATSPSSSTSTSSTTVANKEHRRLTMELKAVAVPTTDDRDNLPVDLRRILTEVARKGECPWLPWNAPAQHIKNTGSPTNNITTSFHFQQQVQRRVTNVSSTLSSEPPRKKHRNGNHINPHRYGSGARKRPLSRLSSFTSSMLSVGSGRTSGSEIEDSTQYECDSEGTSATTNSERSVERKERRTRITIIQALANPAKTQSISSKYKTLREAVRTGIDLVLEHSYRCRGGYKLTTDEMRKHKAEREASEGRVEHLSKIKDPSPEEAFQNRRLLLLALVGTVEDDEAGFEANRKETNGESKPIPAVAIPHRDGPPFTIQRLAEVLLSPERYYTQTHKLCNCLEKLLLVTSSFSAFGGSTGGETLQTRREEQELAALADEKERQEYEQRNRRLRRRMSSSSVEDIPGMDTQTKDGGDEKKVGFNSIKSENEDNRELLEAAAKAQLRHKFDHIGGEHHHGVGASLGSTDPQDLRVIGGNRSMTTSPPPPSLSNAPNLTMPTHAAVASFVRHFADHQNNAVSGGDGGSVIGDGLHAHHALLARPLSPVLFSTGSDSGVANPVALHPSHNMHLLQMHHAVTFPGTSLGNTPLDMVFDPYSLRPPTQAAANTGVTASDVVELENQSGRSSASNSDVDSEGDDVSLDDSASDRSDGSDSGSGQQYEPFTAARVMALNRMQQQQRLQLNRLSTQQQGGESFRPPADHEYQSGDSIDSMMAEDSGGSDSSSSDLAD